MALIAPHCIVRRKIRFVIPLLTLVGCYAVIFYTIASTTTTKLHFLFLYYYWHTITQSAFIVAEEKERVIQSQSTAVQQRAPPPTDGADLNHHQQSLGGNSKLHTKDSMYQRRLIFKRAKMKLLRISIVIVSAFVICWAPYYFMMITFIFLNPDDQVSN